LFTYSKLIILLPTDLKVYQNQFKMFNESQQIKPETINHETINPEPINAIELLKKLGAVPVSFKFIGNEDLNATVPQPKPFYVVPTNFTTALPLEEIISKIDAVVRSEIVNEKTPSDDTGDTFNYKIGRFAWQFKQTQSGENDEFYDKSYSLSKTDIRIYSIKNDPGVYVVEANRLFGNSKPFYDFWKALRGTFE
jgi:hypothetical protein